MSSVRPDSRKIRVLHLIGAMDPGGIETWLMHVARRLDRDRYELDFLVHTEGVAAFDDELQRRGCRIIHCPLEPNLLSYTRRLRSTMLHYGPYDIVHSHHGLFSGYIALVARSAGVPSRIGHSHSDFRSNHAGIGWGRLAYEGFMRLLLRTNTTHLLAASRTSAETLYGQSGLRRPGTEILHYGIDLEPFTPSSQNADLRRELGFSEDDVVVGHVGRFSRQKNHAFLAEIIRELVEVEPRTKLLAIGDGPERSSFERTIRTMGLQHNVVTTGVRFDVPHLMRDVMDVFLFPSLWEGLGLVLVEARAAGLPCFFTDVIPDEADVVPELVFRLSLDRPARDWTALILKNRKSMLSKFEAFQRVRTSTFNIESSVAQLERCYDHSVGIH